jgi:hypothetical protein
MEPSATLYNTPMSFLVIQVLNMPPDSELVHKRTILRDSCFLSPPPHLHSPRVHHSLSASVFLPCPRRSSQILSNARSPILESLTLLDRRKTQHVRGSEAYKSGDATRTSQPPLHLQITSFVLPVEMPSRRDNPELLFVNPQHLCVCLTFKRRLI